MRRQALKVEAVLALQVIFPALTTSQIPFTNDVCIFCATRMQFTTARPASQSQRRSLGSRSSLHKPVSAAVAREEAEQYSDPVAQASEYIRPQRGFDNGRVIKSQGLHRDRVVNERRTSHRSLENLRGDRRTETRSQDQNARRNYQISPDRAPRDFRARPQHSMPTQSSSGLASEDGARHARRVEYSQRPTFNSRQSIKTPPQTPSREPPSPAAARKAAEIDVSKVQRFKKSSPASKPKPAEGAWAKTTTASELTPEEEAMRKQLKIEVATAEEANAAKEAAAAKRAAAAKHVHQPRTSEATGDPGSTALESSPRGARRSRISSGVYRLRMKDLQSEPVAENSKLGQSSQGPSTGSACKELQTHSSQGSNRIATHEGTAVGFREALPEWTGDLRGGWTCSACHYHNFERKFFESSQCGKCGDNPPSYRIRWTCSVCHQTNAGLNEKCYECKSNRPSTGAEIEAQIAKSWKHVRRSQPGMSSAPVPETPSGDTTSPSRSEAMVRGRDLEWSAREIEQEKDLRMKRAKDIRFVGFEDQSLQIPMNVQGSGNVILKSSDSTPQSEIPTSEPLKAESQDFKISETALRTPSQSKYTSDTILGAQSNLYAPSDQTKSLNTQMPATPIKSGEPQRRDQEDRSEVHPESRGERGSRVRRGQSEDTPQIAPNYRLRTAPFVGENRDALRRSSKLWRTRREQAEDIFDDDGGESLAARRKEVKQQRKKAKAAQRSSAPPTPIQLPEFVSVSNLAGMLRLRVEDFAYKLTDLGFEETNHDHILDSETAGLIAAEFNFEPMFERQEDIDLLPLPTVGDKSSLAARPPVVTIMGHVDHGKTTLLDYLRKSSVAASEHGGITQHIGAFSVPMSGGRLVTFLDTPGHEAFLSMRQRGANVTDIIILVVAADDSVKPQTIEAIKHAQNAKVPMIVAINKIDREDSNIEKVKQDLARYGVEIEDYGGDTQVVRVSGKTGQGMDELEDAAVVLADILDMRVPTEGQVEGWVLEATTKKAGRVATVLVRRGTLRPGHVIVAGTAWARVRSLRNEAGAMLKAAGPGTPVEVDGWRDPPSAGDEVIQAPDEQKAKSAIEYRQQASERIKLAADVEAVNESRRLEQEKREALEKAAGLAAANEEGDPDAATLAIPPPRVVLISQEVFFVLKADVSGSVEAITDTVSALGNSEVRPCILRSGVGPITEFDIDHAAAAKGHIINFNTAIDAGMQRMAEHNGIRIIDQNIIYRLTDEVKKVLSERLPDLVTTRVLGEAEIGQVFMINVKGRMTVPVAGCRVRNGVIGKANKVRVLRNKDIIYNGKSLGSNNFGVSL